MASCNAPIANLLPYNGQASLAVAGAATSVVVVVVDMVVVVAVVAEEVLTLGVRGEWLWFRWWWWWWW